ncbi:WD repeat and FYVE domain-containing protein 3-like isoform X2 [Leptinotarsa decemlineata]
MPPLFNKYVAWGFADHSLRIGNYESDKAVFVSESVIQNNGEILVCVCPSPKLIVTAGTSSVVTVWEYESRKKNLSIKYNLYAHTDVRLTTSSYLVREIARRSYGTCLEEFLSGSSEVTWDQ